MDIYTKAFLFIAVLLTGENLKGVLGVEPVDNPIKVPEVYAKEIQKYLDNLLKLATSSFDMKKLDPVDIPKMERTFKRRIVFADLNGGFQTFNSSLKGLSSLHRDGEIYATWETGDSLKVEANMAFNDLQIDSKAKVWLGKIERTLSLIARIKSVKVNTVLNFPLTAGRQARATALTVRDMSRARLDIKGLSPLNWLLEGIGYFVERNLRKNIRHELGFLIMNVINEEIGSIDLSSLLSGVLK